MRLPIITAAMLCIGFTSPAWSQVTEYTSAAQWEQAVGAWTTIEFDEFPSATFITTQYQDLGVTFTGSPDQSLCCNPEVYLGDGAGLYGGFDDLIIMEFSTPQYYFAVDFPGGIQISLYSGDSLLFTGTPYDLSGVGFFAGIVSLAPFDRVVLDDPFIGTYIDDIRFGVPGPGALPLLSLLLLRHARRRHT